MNGNDASTTVWRILRVLPILPISASDAGSGHPLAQAAVHFLVAGLEAERLLQQERVTD